MVRRLPFTTLILFIVLIFVNSVSLTQEAEGTEDPTDVILTPVPTSTEIPSATPLPPIDPVSDTPDPTATPTEEATATQEATAIPTEVEPISNTLPEITPEVTLLPDTTPISGTLPEQPTVTPISGTTDESIPSLTPTAVVSGTLPDLSPSPTSEQPVEVVDPIEWLYRYELDEQTIDDNWLHFGWQWDPESRLSAIQSIAELRLQSTTPWVESSISARFKSHNSSLHFIVRDSVVETRYSLVLQADGHLQLLRVDTIVAETQLNLSAPDDWYTLTLDVSLNRLDALIDGMAVLSYTDAAPLPPGVVVIRGNLLGQESALSLEEVVIQSMTVAEFAPATVDQSDNSVNTIEDDQQVELQTVVVVASVAIPNIVSPADNDVLSTQTPQFKWGKVSGADRYQIQVSTQADFLANVVVDAVLSKTKYKIDKNAPLAEGTYYWRVQAEDEGVWGSYSTATPFKIHLIKTPEDGSFTSDKLPKFAWQKFADAVNYQVELATDASFSSPVTGFPIETTKTSYALPKGTDLAYGVYFWRVNADTGSGIQTSPFMATFTHSPKPPKAPRLFVPLNKSLTNNTQPSFQWDATTSTDGEPFTYQIQIDDHKKFGSPAYDSLVDGFEYIPSATLPDGTHYWRVRTINFLDAPGGWSKAYRVTIDTTPPQIPILVAPVNGSEIADTTPNLSWNKASDAANYEVQLNTGSPPHVTVAIDKKTSYRPLSDLLYTTYSWRVRAIDKAGNTSDWSEERLFDVISGPKDSPLLNRSSVNEVELSWTLINWAIAYEVEVSTDSKFKNGNTAFSAFLPANTLSTITTSLPDGRYYWRIHVMKDNGKWSKWSPVSAFTVDVG